MATFNEILAQLQSGIGIGGAKSPTNENTTPVAPASLEPKPLPVQNIPQVAPQPMTEVPAAPQQDQQPRVVKLSNTTSGIEDADKTLMENQGNRISGELNRQASEQQKLSDLDIKAKEATYAELGNPQEVLVKKQQEQQQLMDSVKADMQDIDTQMEKLKATEYKGFWADKGTDVKIQAGLGVMLGAIGQGLTGGQNVGLQMLQRAMDDDFRLQEANYNKAVKQIELSKLNVDQKGKMIDTLEKQYNIYKVATADAVMYQGEQMASKNGINIADPRIRDAYNKLKIVSEQSKYDLIKDRATKIQNNFAVAQNPMTQEAWSAAAKDDKDSLGSYNAAARDYVEASSALKTGNNSYPLVKIIAQKLQQGSYDPQKFNIQKLGPTATVQDYANLLTGSFQDSNQVKNAMAFLEQDTLDKFNRAKGQMGQAMQAGQQYRGDKNTFFHQLPKELVNKNKDLKESGLKPL